MFENMSERYQKEVSDLVDWYAARLPACGPLSLTQDEYKRGTDALTGNHATLARAAFVEWLAMRNYELSYNQCCSAFFEAAKRTRLLSVTGARESLSSLLSGRGSE